MPNGQLFTTLLVAVTLVAQASQQPPERTPQDVAVFTALVKHPIITSAPGKDGIVLVTETAPSESELRFFEPAGKEYLRRSLRTPAPQTIDEFLKVVRQDGELPAALGEVPGVILVRRADLASLLEAPGRDYWETFVRRYPDACGILSFSRIAYGASGDEVLAYSSFSCGNVCGHGVAVVLQQRDGHWVVVEHLYLWES